MLSSRSVILIIIALAVAGFCGVLMDLAAPPDQGGVGRNSYGTKMYGHRGLFELLDALKLPVRRGMVPPNVAVTNDTCVVFWDSDPGMVRIEPGHLGAVKDWVSAGGNVIIAPARPDKRFAKKTASRTRHRGEIDRDTSLLQEFGLADVSVVPLHPEPPAPSKPVHLSSEDDDDDFDARLSKILAPPKQTGVPVQVSGDLKYLEPVKMLTVVEEDLQVIEAGTGPANAGTLTCRLPDGGRATLAALYRVGSGTVTVVSDPALLDNLSLSKDADNAVLAAELFNHPGKTLVFDEFYHGLTIRGNVFWLLTKPGYGLLLAMLSLAVALWAWREAINLGPPLPQSAVTRRSVGEYVDATARLFQRGNTQLALIRQVRSGVLWAVARKLGLRSKVEDPTQVALALERRDVHAAERLRAAVANTDALLSGVRVPTETNIVETMEQLRKCL